MLRHYFKTSVRHFQKQRLFAAINVSGLAIGIAACLLITLFVQDEWSYDTFHTHADRIYRVNSRLGQPGRYNVVAVTAQPLGPVLETEFPDIDHAIRFWRTSDVVSAGAHTFSEQITFADPAVFEVFTFPLLRGDASTALRQPDGLVLSEAMALKYFDSIDVLGRLVEVKLGEQFHTFTVTGVAAPVGGSSSISFDLLLPFEQTVRIRHPENAESWRAAAIHTYVLLNEGANPEAVSSLFPALIDTYIGEDNQSIAYQLQPLLSIHLDPSVNASWTPPSNPAYSYILGGIALLILCIAAINFTNLAIAGASGRAAEIGVRKVVGADRRQLMRQFWGEALFLSGLALLLGLALAEVFLPVFNDLAGKSLRLDLASSGLTLAILLGVSLLTGLLAGGYPALVLSAFRPAEVLKGQIRTLRAGTLTRGLVVLQFALSIFLIISTLLMQQQLEFLRTKDLGLNTEQVVVLPTHTNEGARLMERMRTELSGHQTVAGISGTSSVPFTDRNAMMYVGLSEEDYFFPIVYRVDPGFTQTLGIDLVEGRFFSAGLATDTLQTVVVNEALVERMGWEAGLGQTLPLNDEPHTVIGVAKNFHFRSLHNEIEPVVLHAKPRWSIDYLLIKVRGDDLPATLATLQAAWQRVAPGFPFDYSFLDDTFDQQYRAEERWGRIIGYAAAFAILIACMGFLGLTALAVTRRTKEIGVRKVFGASTQAILLLLVRDVARLVLVAVVLAAPVVYLVMQNWLDGFAYRIEMSGWTFLVAGLAALFVALLTVSYHTTRAALANPVDSLRYE